LAAEGVVPKNELFVRASKEASIAWSLKKAEREEAMKKQAPVIKEDSEYEESF